MVYNRNYLSSTPSMSPMRAALAKPLENPFEAFIELEERIYNPGQTIKGKLHLELKKKLTCDEISIRLYGSARVFFFRSVSSNQPGVLSKNKAFEQEIILVDQEMNLWEAPRNVGEARNEVTLEDIARMARSTSIRPQLPRAGKLPGFEPGSYDFQFSFALPKDGLYTSFDSKNSAGCVRYYILMQALNRGYTVLRKKHLFPVVNPVRLDADPRALETPKVSSTHLVGKGTVTATMELNKRGYVPGEPISGTITIQNGSKDSIKCCLLRIVQTSNCYSKRPEIDVKVTTFESPGKGLPISKIVSNQTYSYPIELYIPAFVPNFNIEACLNVEYRIVLSIGFVRNSPKNSFLELSTPLLIGTHPTCTIQEFISKGFNTATAPPPYHSIGFENEGFAPPSYEVAVGGRSDIAEDDGDDYSPLLYHYNFGHSHGKVE